MFQLAEELSAALPGVVAPHALGLWWLFAYPSEAGPRPGIGIHADPAAAAPRRVASEANL